MATKAQGDEKRMRRAFLAGLGAGVRVVRPILSALLAAMVALGALVGAIEGWPLQDAIYFTFVSGLTIGYGDLVPTTLLTRGLAVAIGLCGILVTALLAAIAVEALAKARERGD